MSVLWPEDAQTPTGFTKAHPPPARHRRGRDLHTYPARQLRAQAKEHQHQHPAGRKRDRVITRGGPGHTAGKGGGGLGGGGRRTSPLTLRAPRPAEQGRSRGPSFRQPAGKAERTQTGYAPLRPPAPRRRRKRRARRRHSGRAPCAADHRRCRSPPRCGRSTGSFPPPTHTHTPSPLQRKTEGVSPCGERPGWPHRRSGSVHRLRFASRRYPAAPRPLTGHPPPSARRAGTRRARACPGKKVYAVLR